MARALPSLSVAAVVLCCSMPAPGVRAAEGASLRLPEAVAKAAGTGLWSLQPLARVAPPRLSENNWSPHPVDAFILQKLQQAALKPGAAADRRTLIRRATFDLTGLPPTPEEVDAFARDSSADAYPRLIERLLASPHYGEQWARHWLDLARYSDTKGYVFAREEKRWVHAAIYRDWVAQALNSDMPYRCGPDGARRITGPRGDGVPHPWPPLPRSLPRHH